MVPRFPSENNWGKTHQLFVKMSKRKSIISTVNPIILRRSPRFTTYNETPEPVQPKSTRRSSVFLQKNDPSASKDSESHKDFLESISKKSSKTSDASRKSRILRTGLRKSPRLENRTEELKSLSLRRSSRLSSGQKVDDEYKICSEKISKKPKVSSNDQKSVNVSLRRSSRFYGEHSGTKSNKSDGKENLLNVGMSVNACEESEGKNGKGKGSFGAEQSIEEGKEIVIRGKRKRDDEELEVTKMWTVEQEEALQRAYFAAKPTPHFWKKVSKLVPGKSAQECFDRIHSDHLTPPQPRPRSRAKGTKTSSPLEYSLFSRTKRYKIADSKATKSRTHKPKSHLAHKTVRQLLQKNFQPDQDSQADLFLLLEPNINPSTPMNVPEKQGFLQKCNERSSSSHKKPLSRFSGSLGKDFVSPPVLKPVKNRVLHEKYIDQLHCREARRKATTVRSRSGILINGTENVKVSHAVKSDVVGAAKHALVSEARNAISQFQQLQENAVRDIPDFDDGDDDCDARETDDFEIDDGT